MKAALLFFIFILLMGSASAELISVTTPDGPIDVNNIHPNVEIGDEQARITQVTVKTKSNNVETTQNFVSATDPALTSRGVKGTVTLRRVKDGTPTREAPLISQHYLFTQAQPVSIPEMDMPSTPTGGYVIMKEGEDKGYAPIFILILTLVAIAVVGFASKGPHMKLMVVFLILFGGSLFIFKFNDAPTGYTIRELAPANYELSHTYDALSEPTAVTNAYTVTWTDGGPVTYLGGGMEQQSCNDGIDNDGDGLIDCADPGCHSDGNAQNLGSCVPTDNLETDMLEYDHAPVVDNEIDIYDVVNYAQHLGGENVLVHCLNSACSNQAGFANCVGDTDPNNDLLVNAADLSYLEQQELANTDSRPSICFNP